MTETKTVNDALSSDARCDTVELALGGMTCAACAARIEKVLGRVPGVEMASVNFATAFGTVSFDATRSATFAASAGARSAQASANRTTPVDTIAIKGRPTHK